VNEVARAGVRVCSFAFGSASLTKRAAASSMHNEAEITNQHEEGSDAKIILGQHDFYSVVFLCHAEPRAIDHDGRR
jgi:hypothetical protein